MIGWVLSLTGNLFFHSDLFISVHEYDSFSEKEVRGCFLAIEALINDAVMLQHF
jgi:hypothetical protein